MLVMNLPGSLTAPSILALGICLLVEVVRDQKVHSVVAQVKTQAILITQVVVEARVVTGRARLVREILK